jgi:regulatory protein
MKMDSDEIDTIIVKLIQDNFLNESRFACSFARGKHHKIWGKQNCERTKIPKHWSIQYQSALKEISNENI